MISPRLLYFVVFAIAIFFGKTVFAELKVKSHNLARNKVLLLGQPQDTEGLNPGYRLTLRLDGDKTCDLEVLERKIDQVTADSSLCAFRKEISEGQVAFKAGTAGPAAPSVTPTDTATPTEPKAVEPAPEETSTTSTGKFAFDLGLLYSFIDSYDYDYTTSPVEVNGEGDLDTDGAAGFTIGFTYRKAEDLNWFIHGAFLYEFARDLDGGLVSNTSQPKMSYLAAYGNFNYEVAPHFYLIGGLGIGGLFFTDVDPEMVTTLGPLLNIGIGTHFLDRRVYVELIGRYQDSGADQDVTGGGAAMTEIEYKNINAFGAILTARYAFF